MAQGAKILLLDEPTTGLDPIASDQMVHSLRSLADEGACVVMVSHDLGRHEDVCDSILWVSDGNISLDSREFIFMSE